LELRSQIWNWAFPLGRLVHLRADIQTIKPPQRLDATLEQGDTKEGILLLSRRRRQWAAGVRHYRLFAQLRPTPLSAVSFEARNYLPKRCSWQVSTEATKREDCIGAGIEIPVNTNSQWPTQRRHILVGDKQSSTFTNLDLQNDVLFFAQEEDMEQTLDVICRWQPESFFLNVRRIAMFSDHFDMWIHPNKNQTQSPILRFPNLKWIYIIYDEPGHRYDNGSIEDSANEEATLRRQSQSKLLCSGYNEKLKWLAEELESWKRPGLLRCRDSKHLSRYMECYE